MTCSQLSLGLEEPLAATATQAARWLLVEVRGGWERDVVAENGLPDAARRRLESWLALPGTRVQFVRRPDRREGPVAVFSVRSGELGGRARRFDLDGYEELAELDLEGGGEPVAGPLLLVCTHGRRDPCCARNGPPVYAALEPHAEPGGLWQSSHQGGHRFSANLLALPAGISLGRVPAEQAPAVAAELAEGRIPLVYYRGRTLYAPAVQAAEIAVRERFGLTGVGDLRLVEERPGQVRFATPSVEVEVAVEEQEGPATVESCGAEPSPSRRFAVRF
jgi:hypothetical protein